MVPWFFLGGEKPMSLLPTSKKEVVTGNKSVDIHIILETTSPKTAPNVPFIHTPHCMDNGKLFDHIALGVGFCETGSTFFTALSQ